jgi:hypothetical protein
VADVSRGVFFNLLGWINEQASENGVLAGNNRHARDGGLCAVDNNAGPGRRCADACGYACIFTSPDNLPKKILEPIGVKLAGASQQISASFRIRLDVEKLLLQWALVGMVAYGAVVSLKYRD